MTAREISGLLLFAGGCLVVGQALLAAAGLVSAGVSALRAAGLALFTGWACTGLLVSLMLMAGLSASLWQLAIGWALIAATGTAFASCVRRTPRSAMREHEPRSWPASVAQLVVGGYLAALLVRALVPLGTLNPDAWTQWLAKAKVIYFLGGLDTGVGGFTHQINSDYPPLDAALEATAFRFAGSADFLALPFFHWIVLAAFVGAVAHLLLARAPAALVWSSLAMLLLAPKLLDLVGSSLADEPLSLLIALAGVTGTAWVMDSDPGLGLLSAVFLAAAALTKNEGLMLGLVLAIVLALATRRRSGLALVAVPAVAYLPWRLWLRAHDVPSNFGYDFGRLVHPRELLDHTSYLWYGTSSLLHHFFAPSEWLLIVPAAFVLALVAAWRQETIATIALGFPLLVFVAYSCIYWLGNGICTWMPARSCDGSWRDIEWLVGPSADRIVAPVAITLAVLFPLLVPPGHAPRVDSRASVPR